MLSLCFQVIAKKDVLVPKVKPATGNDGMRPAIHSAAVRLIEAASFFIARRHGVNEGDAPFAVFGAYIKPAIRISDGAFAKFLPLLPDRLAGLEILARPPFAL